MSSEEAGQGRESCTPCGGTGKVSSALGGDPHEVTCPWCGGSGRFRAGADAQQGSGSEDSTGGSEDSAGD